MKIAVFAGTFDPITIGHEYVIEKASKLFDRLIVALCINVEKTPVFDTQIRLKMLENVCKKYENVEVVYHEGMLVDLMKQKGAKYSVRGVRNNTDYDYENYMHSVNKGLYSEMETIFFPCEERLKNVSSTFVRNKIKNGEIPTDLLSNEVIEVIKSTLKDN